MAGKCANKLCANSSRQNGKLFRLDIDIGSTSGASKQKTAYIWLCDACAQKMHPTVEVIDNTVRVRLAKNVSAQETDNDRLWKRAN